MCHQELTDGDGNAIPSSGAIGYIGFFMIPRQAVSITRGVFAGSMGPSDTIVLYYHTVSRKCYRLW